LGSGDRGCEEKIQRFKGFGHLVKSYGNFNIELKRANRCEIGSSQAHLRDGE